MPSSIFLLGMQVLDFSIFGNGMTSLKETWSGMSMGTSRAGMALRIACICANTAQNVIRVEYGETTSPWQLEHTHVSFYKIQKFLNCPPPRGLSCFLGLSFLCLHWAIASNFVLFCNCKPFEATLPIIHFITWFWISNQQAAHLVACLFVVAFCSFLGQFILTIARTK